MLVALNYLAGIVIVVCLVWVIVAIFKSGQTGLGIACAVLSLCGIGFLITFIVGWVNATKWGIKNVMLIWTIAWVVGVATGVAMPHDQFVFIQK
jgi:hypothetical protein